MENKLSQQEENVMLYATYNILYVNDVACNLIKELVYELDDKDKETKKIYGALLKRAKAYFKKVNTIVGDKIEYFADYCGEMDDVCDPFIDKFREELYKAYKSHNIGDEVWYAKVEIMRSMCELAVHSNKHLIDRISIKYPRAKWLSYYCIEDIMKVANNFTHWVYRKVSNGVTIDFSQDSDVMVSFRALNTALMEYDNFDLCYRKAIEYELERNKQ